MQLVRSWTRSANRSSTTRLWTAMNSQGRLVYDGDLTGRPVSPTSTTYPGAAYGHMDDAVQLGYQAAVVSLHSPCDGAHLAVSPTASGQHGLLYPSRSHGDGGGTAHMCAASAPDRTAGTAAVDRDCALPQSESAVGATAGRIGNGTTALHLPAAGTGCGAGDGGATDRSATATPAPGTPAQCGGTGAGQGRDQATPG